MWKDWGNRLLPGPNMTRLSWGGFEISRSNGIGPEVLREGRKVMDAAAEVAGITWQWKEYPFGAEHWLKHRKGLPTLMSEEDMADLGAHDAIYFGAVGDPRVPEQVEQAGALLWMRFYFDQYINLRPAKLLRGVTSPLAGKKAHDINFYVVRENSEDFYIGLGARFAGRKSREEFDPAPRALQGPVPGGRRPGARGRVGLPDSG